MGLTLPKTGKGSTIGAYTAPRFVDVKTAARLLDVSVSTFYRMAPKVGIKGVALGIRKHILFYQRRDIMRVKGTL